MKNLIRIIASSLLAISFNVNGATDYDNLWIFGDSFSDRGNAHARNNFWVPAAHGYLDGRWSNGAMWVEHLASGLGLPAPIAGFDSPLAGESTAGNNFAVGGAKTGTGNSLGTFFQDTGLVSQLHHANGFLQNYSNPATNGSSLFVVLAGANDSVDVDFSNQSSLNAVVDAAMANIDTAIRDLYNVGARSFMMPNLPGHSVLGGPNLAPQNTATFANAFNPALSTKIDALRNELAGAEIIEVDFQGLFQDILNNPANFGITNTTDPCLDYVGFSLQGSCGAAADEYLFFDYFHPSATAHEALGVAALAAVQPVPVPAALPLLISAIFSLSWFRRRQHS